MSKIKIEKPDWLASEEIKKLIAEMLQDLGVEIEADKIHLEHPADESHGDYASNLAMAKFDELKVQSEKLKINNPLELAELIADKLSLIINYPPASPARSNGGRGQSLIIDRVAVAPPGFINFWLKKDYLIQKAKEVGDEEKFKDKMSEISFGKTMVIDYSAPNIAKPFGIGHMRSTNIGQSIYNLYSVLGWRTIGDNHLGDWGTQFGKLIVAIKKWWKKDLDELSIAKLLELYIKFHRQAEENPELEDQARAWFKKLEEGDKEAKKIWQLCVDISMDEFDRVYQMLGVEIDQAYGESFYYFQGWMDKVVGDLEKRGMLKKSQGAKVVDIEGFDTPAMVIKSDGATTYLTRDLATIKFRVEKWDPDLIIYEVGSPQKLHFQQVFSVAEQLDYISSKKLVHVAHGLLRMKTGKFSTRKGKTIHLEQVLNEAVKRAKDLVESSRTSKDLSKQEKKKIAQAVGVGGVKFNDLKQEPERDIVFNWDQILSMDGYSAPYLQYTAARANSVLRKSQFSNSNFQINDKMFNDQMVNKEEEALLRVFYQFPEIIISAAENFGPHLVCQYLFDLAQKFNLFYQKHRIIGSGQNGEGKRQQEKENFRLFLTQTTASVLKTGLDLLGIETLDKM
jgi:arginyl-tRNA synthetase